MGLKSLGGMRRIRLMGRGRLTASLRVVAWLMRLVVGATFLYSGFVKAIDPSGTIYKVADYLSALGWQWPAGVLITVAFVLFGIEFVVGAMLLLGSFRRTSALCATLIMLFMLPLSLWLAVANPVADCGCFGDAMHLSNWETFWKNVGLTAACIWLLFFNRRIHWVVTPALQWLSLTLTIAYVMLTGAVGYLVQPPLDFRPYKEGLALTESDPAADDENIRLIYTDPHGERHSFRLSDNLPDGDGWTFVEQQQVSSAQIKPSERDLRIWDENGEEDVTDAVISTHGYQLILFMPAPAEVGIRDTWPINSLYRYCIDNDVDMIAVMTASPRGIGLWRDLSLSEYPIYTAEDTAIKEVVRGNPAVVFLKDGKVIWKQTLDSLDIDALTAQGSSMSMETMYTSTLLLLKKLTILYVAATLLLIFFSFLQPIWRMSKLMRRRRRIRRSHVSVSGSADPEV